MRTYEDKKIIIKINIKINHNTRQNINGVDKEKNKIK